VKNPIVQIVWEFTNISMSAETLSSAIAQAILLTSRGGLAAAAALRLLLGTYIKPLLWGFLSAGYKKLEPHRQCSTAGWTKMNDSDLKPQAAHTVAQGSEVASDCSSSKDSQVHKS
jgi:hypothetical protein